jgi:glutamine synthetase
VSVDGSVEARHDFVLRSVEDRGVRFVRLWFVDVLGSLKSMAIPVSELASALEDGVGVDGSSLEGSVRLAERDVIAHPDPLTFQILPWRPGSLVARMFCEVRGPDGRPFAADSRLALTRVVRQAAELGFSFEVGSEIEFFLYAAPPGDGSARGVEDALPVALDEGAYFDLTALDVGSDFRRRTIEYLEQMGIPVKSAHHEVAPSQHELDLQHTDALSMADALMTFRLAVKEAARTVGCYATFMPQPVEGQPGSGMHLHLSLFDADGNAFYSPDQAEVLSPVGRAFLAGILAHGPELCAVTNQWVNSYKRLANGFEAPQHVSWTRHGRSALVRVPSLRRDRPGGARIELRSPDPAANPYLVFALVLGAGLRGIERGYELEAETVDEAGPLTRRLPRDLDEATDLFDASELARDTLGDRLCDWYVLNKRREWAEYSTTVSSYERRRYLRL